MGCKVRLSSVLALGAMFASGAAMRADTVFTSFGPNQSYNGVAWVDVGAVSLGNQVVAFPFVPTATAALSSVDIAVPHVGTTSGVVVSILSNNGGAPGGVLDTLSQVASLSTAISSFSCGTSCPVLQAGSEYWLVAQESDGSTRSQFFFSPTATGTWYYNEAGSTTGPWNVATLTPSIGAFDVNANVTQSPVPEPSSLLLLGSGMMGVLGMARRRFVRQG